MLTFDSTILAGQIAPSSVAGYQQDLTGYQRFCDHGGREVLDAASLARWRQMLAEDTRLSPHTINRRMAAVKSVVKEAALQGYLDQAVAETFGRVVGVPVKALKDRIRERRPLTPAQVRRMCDAPDLYQAARLARSRRFACAWLKWWPCLRDCEPHHCTD